MRKVYQWLIGGLIALITAFLGIGYAAVSDTLFAQGDAVLSTPTYDVYISHVTPSLSGGAEVTGYFSTVMSLKITTSRTATFSITVTNNSDKTYVYERLIDGGELGIDGAYVGSDILGSVSGIAYLAELAPGASVTFNLTITNSKGITTDNFYLKFNFIEKQDIGILPGNDDYDITFKYGNGQPDTVLSLHKGEFVPRPENPTRAGYEFIGWYTDSSYSTAWNFEVDRVQDDTILYAGWKVIENPTPTPTEYAVTFKPGNGDPDGTIIVTAGSLVPIPASPTMEGYTFIGWYTDAECTSPWNFDTDRVRAKMILYGGWEIYVPPVPPDCNITFKPGNGDPDTTIVVLTGMFIPRPTLPTRDGYVFTGWYIDESCTTAWNFEVNKAEGHMTLYGGWEEEIVPEEYTVTFNPGNGDAYTTATVTEGDLVPIPTLPTRDGYTFIGWYTDSACTNAWNFDTDRPTSDMTLYGGWEKEQEPNPDDEYHGGFIGLVEALLSDSNNCLNHSDVIHDAVMESLTSKKRPKEDAPILHSSVNSVSGGTMSAIASFANSKLVGDTTMDFIFEADSDPAYQDKRMTLYMYYSADCKNASTGDKIIVYKQIVSKASDGTWFADGTYVGKAAVGNFFGGGNAGKDVKTINPYTWTASTTISE